MDPIMFKQANTTVAKDQPEYRPLPAYVSDTETISCWRLTWGERLRLLWSGRLWLRQMNFGRPLQPQLPSVETPFIDGAATRTDVQP